MILRTQLKEGQDFDDLSAIYFAEPNVHSGHFCYIIRLQNTGVYGIYNPKALGCGARAKQGHY